MTNPKITRFGAFVKHNRESKGWTQTDLGAKIGINSSAISRIENGTKRLPPKKLILISQLFEIELSKAKELYFADKIAQ